MRGFNPALVTHMNLDLDKIIGEEKAPTKNTGLLAPKKSMMNKGQEKINNPLYRVANHVKILRDKRNEIKDA
jgi:hypothetical protein|tara:strand:+ start:2010 stop:2225 length:216 start_codon:yes stop_codon:yes gene_type:complete